jgi:3'-5' exoribonuclease
MQSKGYFLNAIPTNGEVTLLAVVTEKKLRPKRMGGSYLHLRLEDRTGELEAKVWEHPEQASAQCECNQVAKVRGTIEHFNERPQLIVNRLRQLEPGEYDPADYYSCSTRDPEEMSRELLGFVDMIKQPELRRLLQMITTDAGVADRLKAAPAALRIHHGFRSGLLEHIVSMCELAVVLAGKYQNLKLDWLIAGAILHDLGKIETLTFTGVHFVYTARGQLIEHVTLGLEILERFARLVPELSIETKTMLQHLIISHHGEMKHGALRQPMTAEAFVLHMMDLMDARLEQMFRLIDEVPAGEEFTSYVPSLERQLFRGFADPIPNHETSSTRDTPSDLFPLRP